MAKYKMTISRLTVDKLGIKLYDRVSAVIAELVANSYDADASEVKITAPMGEMLATKDGAALVDKNFTIEVSDNGIGMTPDEINDFYLVVGAERRKDSRRGDVSKKFKRKVMGRKGVGKIAPFGVCQKIEIISSGGEIISGKNDKGKAAKGYLTAHLILDREKIMKPTDAAYNPEVGKLDGIVSSSHGTTLKLTIFDYRRVPTMEEFERQLAQRFGLATSNWKITLFDSQKTNHDDEYTRQVGEFSVSKMPDTEIKFDLERDSSGKPKSPPSFRAFGSDGKILTDLASGFAHEGVFYPVTGWVSYSKQPYKDDLMAGVRIYCRGKIAAQTHIFNMKAGFTGEYDIRSYLVGELHADWLDEAEDLIRTDRQDILWSHDLGQVFEEWGQALVKKIGALTREPTRKKAWELFKEVSKIEARVEKAFPSSEQGTIRDRTMEIAKTIAKTTRPDELDDKEHVESIVQLSLLLGPHITLDEKLREVADGKDRPLTVISEILKTARIAELSSFGRIADDRVKVIKTVEQYKDDPNTLEVAFQKLISAAPWLVNPQWSPITANQSFETLKEEFKKFYKKKIGEDLELENFSDTDKRADFVMSNQDNVIELVEIKRPSHKLQNDEMVRINKYAELMDEFLEDPGNKAFKELFPQYHITLVCDGLALTGVHKSAFEGLVAKKILDRINWNTFLLKTRKMHEEFLKEAERQKKLAVKQ
jgi:hypothetical protein